MEAKVELISQLADQFSDVVIVQPLFRVASVHMCLAFL
jgi:hypothetical protein